MIRRPLPMLLLTAAAVAAGALWSLADERKRAADANAPAAKAPSTGAAAHTRAAYPAELTRQQEEKVLAYAKRKSKDYYERIVKYRQTEPKYYQATLRALLPLAEQYERMPQRVRDAYDRLDLANYSKLWQLARDIQKTADAGVKARLEAELYQLTAVRFEAEQIIREYRIQQIMEQAKRLQKDLEERAANREAVIRESYEQMLQNAARMAEATRSRKAPTSRPATQPAAAPAAPVRTHLSADGK